MLYSVELVSDPTAFQLLVQPLIEAEPTDYSVLASNLAPFASAAKASTDQSWYLVRRGDDVVAAAMRTPPHPLHIPSNDPHVGTALANFALKHNIPTPGVGGIAGAARAFADLYAPARELAVVTTMQMWSYDLPVPAILPSGVVGAARTADLGELERIDQWMSQFMAEADPEFGAYRSLVTEVTQERMMLWEAHSEVVSQAFVSSPSAGVARISGVFTAPQHRGHGYGRAVVAHLSAQVQRQGVRCMLFTDAANATSNHIYQQIGYRRRGDSVMFGFV